MATLAPAPQQRISDDRFFLITAFAIAALFVAGFTNQLAAGRSSFASPPIVHVHAIVFFGWVTIFVTQAALVARGSIALHRRLGWLGLGWSVAMVGVAIALMLHIVRGGTVPFFFQPQQFLIGNLSSVFAFAGLTWAAVAMRRRTDWHRRLHVAGITLILGPAFGRLLPMPLLVPWAFQIAFGASAIALFIIVLLDVRRTGHLHPAWRVGLSVSVATMIIAQLIAFSPLGAATYQLASSGSAGAQIDPLAFAAPQANGRVTGR